MVNSSDIRHDLQAEARVVICYTGVLCYTLCKMPSFFQLFKIDFTILILKLRQWKSQRLSNLLRITCEISGKTELKPYLPKSKFSSIFPIWDCFQFEYSLRLLMAIRRSEQEGAERKGTQLFRKLSLTVTFVELTVVQSLVLSLVLLSNCFRPQSSI